MLLQNKNAVIYGAGGSLGSAVSRALALAGAQVILTGPRSESLQKVSSAITAAGGKATMAIVDAFDHRMVEKHLESVIEELGTVDISFNVAGVDVRQDVPLTTLAVEEYINPVSEMLRSRFITATAAGRVMMKQRSGVILSLTATPGGIGYPYTGGFSAACVSIENLCCNLAAELGIYGIRVVNIRSGGSPDSKVFADALESDPEIMKPILEQMKKDTMLRKMPPMADIANTAVFLCSELAASITGVTIDVTAGTTAALNYRARE